MDSEGFGGQRESHGSEPVAGFCICRGTNNQTDRNNWSVCWFHGHRSDDRSAQHSSASLATVPRRGSLKVVSSMVVDSRRSVSEIIQRILCCFRVSESCARMRGETRAVLRAGGRMRKVGAAASCVRWSSRSLQSWSVFTWMHPNCCASLRRAFPHCRPLTAQALQRYPQVRAGCNEKTARRTGLRSLQSRGIMSPTRHCGPRPARMPPSLVRPPQVIVGCGVQRWRLGEERRRLCSTGRAVHNHGETCSEQGDMVHGEPECPLPSCGVAPTRSCARCGSLGFSPRSRPSLLLLA